MPLGSPGALRIAVSLQFCAIAFAFQASPEGPLVPRIGPPPSAADVRPVLRVDASLVLIPAHVTTSAGAPVTNLKKEDFVLFEDGAPRTITHFAQDDAPVSAGLLLDISGSMKNKMAKSSQAAAEFFKSANPQDEFFLVEFNGRPKLKIPFTSDWLEIPREIARAKAFGLTALLDAIHLSLAEMKHARNERKALIILSDGGDNFSRRSLRELTTTLLEADVQVYSMGVFDGNYAGETPNRGEERPQAAGPNVGRQRRPSLSAGQPGKPAGHRRQIAHELRSQYILGFSPATSVTDGKFHRVDLNWRRPPRQAIYALTTGGGITPPRSSKRESSPKPNVTGT